MKRTRHTSFTRYLLWTQGLYFLITAVWPLVHIDSFMMITGPKEDVWLVKTVSVLILSVALPLLYGASYSTDYRLIRLIAISAASGLAIIDVWYYLEGVIKWVYLLDAFAEITFIICWCIADIPNSKPAGEKNS